MASPFLNLTPSLLFESERLKTFFEPTKDGSVKLWSSAPDITPEELAKDGFYFMKKEDHCACIFCRGIVGAWEKGDSVRDEHQRHFGGGQRPFYDGCRFIKGEPIGNVPMSLCEHLVPMWRETVFKRIEDNNKNPSIISPDFSFLDKREASFESSPFSMVMRKKLSAAGFYSYLVSDHVRCFRCGLGLRNWSESMNPLEKHAEYSPDCIVVKLFDKPLAPKTHVDKKRNSPFTVKKVDDTLVDLVIKEGDIERCVASMGFPLNDIKEAVKNRLLDTGNKFWTTTQCIEEVMLTMERRMINETIRATGKQRREDERPDANRSEIAAAMERAVSDAGAREVSDEDADETAMELNEHKEGSSSAPGWEDGRAQSPLILTKSIRERLPRTKHVLIMSPHNSTLPMRRSTAAVGGVGHPPRATPFLFF